LKFHSLLDCLCKTDQGFPGRLVVRVRYTLNSNNELDLHMEAVTDKPTVVNLANHSYFNLAGHSSGNALDHILQINSMFYTPADAEMVPTGRVVPVAGSPLDFRRECKLRDNIEPLLHDGPTNGGFDHNFVLSSAVHMPPGSPSASQHTTPITVNGGCNDDVPLHCSDGELVWAATLTDPSSGRVMRILTGEPAMQLYSSNWLPAGPAGKDGALYGKHNAVCLETQQFPNAVNQPKFPSPVLQPHTVYEHVVSYQFSTLHK
jgi:aldose 1-epimerase